MKKINLIIVLAIFCLTASAQWSNTGNNFTTGKVGIGTTSLSIGNTGVNNLVIGDASSSEGLVVNAKSTNDGILAFASDGNMVSRFIYNNPSGTLNYYKHGVGNLFSINSNGRIGIGTTSPSWNLEINDGDNVYSTIHSTGANSLAGLGLVNDARTWVVRVEGEDDDKFQIRDASANAQRLTINTNGYTGIGTTIPLVRLQLSNANLNLQSDVIYNQESLLILEDEDAQMDLVSDAGGSWGSELTFKEVNSSGNLVNNWGIIRTTGSTPDLKFQFGNNANSPTNTTLVSIKANGNVGIGVNPTEKLTVDGKIRAEEVKVEIVNGPDYVFESDYQLRTLKETKEYITQNKHLPEIPSAKEMESNGVDLGDMNMRLLKKIEELTLYQIELLERLEKAEQEISQLKNN
ncbi:MAG: hypothetical protein KI790_15485 [Cyclobacteriaceae bacterium]|nr:hypothetical protein [Cyclobacteriaceae bacterium HetDA_MAG_MS6]